MQASVKAQGGGSGPGAGKPSRSTLCNGHYIHQTPHCRQDVSSSVGKFGKDLAKLVSFDLDENIFKYKRNVTQSLIEYN